MTHWVLTFAVVGLCIAVLLTGAIWVIQSIGVGIETRIVFNYILLTLWPTSIGLHAGNPGAAFLVLLWGTNVALYGVLGLLAGSAELLFKGAGWVLTVLVFTCWIFVLTRF